MISFITISNLIQKLISAVFLGRCSTLLNITLYISLLSKAELHLLQRHSISNPDQNKHDGDVRMRLDGDKNSKLERTKTKTSNLTQPKVIEDSTSPNQAVLVKVQRVYRISGKPNLAIFWLFWTIGKVKQRRKRKPLTGKPCSDYQLMRTRGGFSNLSVRTNWITRFEGKRRR